MAVSTTLPSAKIPDLIEINVQPYDKNELDNLKKLSCWTSMEAQMGDTVDGKVVKIPKEQFLLYSMFNDLDCGSPNELREDSHAQEIRLRRRLQCQGKYLNAHPNLVPNSHSKDAEEIGVAISLAVADQMFGTTEMDWLPISISKNKSFDYIGSNGTFKPEVEAKGSFLDDSKAIVPTISNHKKGIKDKKKQLGTASGDSARIGMIASIGKTGCPLLRIVDPPPLVEDRTPRDQQTLFRLAFLSRWISFVSPRSALSIALRGRVGVLNAIRDIEELDGVELVNGTGSIVDVSPNDFQSIHSRFFATKSTVTDGPTGGWVVRTGDLLFFFGIMQELLSLAVTQNFERIRDYRRVPGTVSKEVRCVFSPGRFDRMGLKEVSLDVESVGESYLSFLAKGDLHYTAGGLVFGWLDLPSTF